MTGRDAAPPVKERSRRRSLRALFSLRQDQADPVAIDAAIRDGVRVVGTNLWVLMFAILTASVGLNVNSTAVIIGAMLISPLMGPIIGAGYGAAIQDSALIRQSFRTLGIFVAISLAASTLYFALSPLSTAQSELLARTSPTIWDVLIAFFGGAAGMIGLTRKEKTTLIPGVAIATALMPPLCTAGYGLASGQPRFFFGAFYLFTINGVFIAFATLAIARVLKLPMHTFADAAARRRGRLLIGLAVTVTLLPSVYLATQLVRDEWFGTRANRYLAAIEASAADLVILNHQIDGRAQRIQVTLLGKGITPERERGLVARLGEFDLAEATLVIRHPDDGRPDIDAIGQVQAQWQDAQRKTLVQLEDKAAQLAVQAARVAALEQQIRQRSTESADQAQLADEVRAQWPAARNVTVARPSGAAADARSLLVVIDSPRPLPAAELRRLRRWLAVRLPDTAVRIVIGQSAR